MAEATIEANLGKSGTSKKYVLIGALIIVLVMIAAGVSFYFLKPVAAQEEVIAPSKAKPAKALVFLQLESFTVNLQPEEDYQSQYLQIVMSLHLDDDKDVDIIKQHMPEIRHRIISVVSSKTPLSISTVEGKKLLQNAILHEINKPFSGSDSEQNVSDVFFTSFVIQ